MPALASPSTWRTKPYTYQGYLYVDRPEILFQARVNQASFIFPLVQVTFDTVTTGAYTDVVSGLTVLFGSSAGADDLGRQRVRKAATSTILYFGESSIGDHDGEVVPADNAYITVINERRIWTIPPRIDDSNVIYKDYEIPYTEGGRNYGLRPGPLAVGGCSKAALIDPVSEVATFQFDSSDSIAITASTTLSTLWDVGDGAITVGSDTDDAITATFPAGRRYVTCTVTDSNGDAHVRYILTVALDPDDATWYPITDFEIVEHRLTRDGGAMSFVVHEALPSTTFYDGVAVLYFEREYYGGVEGSLAGPSGDEQIKMVSWLDMEREEPRATERGIENGTELRCISTIERMRRINLLPQRVESDASPGDWREMANLTTGRFLWYLLRWHSTVLDVADLILPDLDASIAGWDTTASNLLDQVAEIPDERAKAFTCDQRGVLRVLDNPLLQDSGDRTATEIVALTNADLIRCTMERDRSPRTYWLDIEGVTTGSSGDGIFAIAPGEGPGQAADRASFTRQLVADQTELNARGGHEYARINSPWLPLGIELVNAGDAGIEPALMEWVDVTLPAASNERARGLTNVRCLPMEVTYRHGNDETRLKECEISLFIETEGFPATTVIRPKGGANLPAFEFPAFTFPEIIWEPLDGEGSFFLNRGTGNMALINSDGYIYRTSDWTTPEAAGGPTWDRVSTGITKILGFSVDPWSPLYIGTGTTVNGWVVATNGIYRLTDLFGATPGATLQYTYSGGNTIDWAVNARHATIEFGWGQQNFGVAALYYRSLAGHTGTWAAITTDGTNWSEVQISGFYDTDFTFGWYTSVFVSSRQPGLVYASGYDATGAYASTLSGALYKSTDHGASWAKVTNPNPQAIYAQSVRCPWDDNTNQNILYMGGHSYSAGQPVGRTGGVLYRQNADLSISDITPVVAGKYYTPNRPWNFMVCPNDRLSCILAGYEDIGLTSAVFTSRDGGDTWTQISTTAVGYELTFIAGDDNSVLYLLGSSGRIDYSTNFGTTIESKMGNISSFSPATHVGIAGG